VAGRAAAEVARLGRDRWDPLLLPLPTCIGYVLLSLLAMSVAGMLAMKEQYPRLRNGRPWRQKDIDDMVVLRRLAETCVRSGLFVYDNYGCP
jgi:hypothetical protein